jgi:hypothetical protein
MQQSAIGRNEFRYLVLSGCIVRQERRSTGAILESDLPSLDVGWGEEGHKLAAGEFSGVWGALECDAEPLGRRDWDSGIAWRFPTMKTIRTVLFVGVVREVGRLGGAPSQISRLVGSSAGLCSCGNN